MTGNAAPPVADTRAYAKAIRLCALDMTSRGKSSHVGSALSMVDIVTVLYGHVMRYDPASPRWASGSGGGSRP